MSKKFDSVKYTKMIYSKLELMHFNFNIIYKNSECFQFSYERLIYQSGSFFVDTKMVFNLGWDYKLGLIKSIERIITNNYNLLFELRILNITPNKIIDRLDEFDVIKNGKVDLISLESLFRYYNIEYDYEQFYLLENSAKLKNNIPVFI